MHQTLQHLVSVNQRPGRNPDSDIQVLEQKAPLANAVNSSRKRVRTLTRNGCKNVDGRPPNEAVVSGQKCGRPRNEAADY